MLRPALAPLFPSQLSPLKCEVNPPGLLPEADLSMGPTCSSDALLTHTSPGNSESILG